MDNSISQRRVADDVSVDVMGGKADNNRNNDGSGSLVTSASAMGTLPSQLAGDMLPSHSVSLVSDDGQSRLATSLTMDLSTSMTSSLASPSSSAMATSTSTTTSVTLPHLDTPQTQTQIQFHIWTALAAFALALPVQAWRLRSRGRHGPAFRDARSDEGRTKRRKVSHEACSSDGVEEEWEGWRAAFCRWAFRNPSKDGEEGEEKHRTRSSSKSGDDDEVDRTPRVRQRSPSSRARSGSGSRTRSQLKSQSHSRQSSLSISSSTPATPTPSTSSIATAHSIASTSTSTSASASTPTKEKRSRQRRKRGPNPLKDKSSRGRQRVTNWGAGKEKEVEERSLTQKNVEKLSPGKEIINKKENSLTGSVEVDSRDESQGRDESYTDIYGPSGCSSERSMSISVFRSRSRKSSRTSSVSSSRLDIESVPSLEHSHPDKESFTASKPGEQYINMNVQASREQSRDGERDGCSESGSSVPSSTLETPNSVHPVLSFVGYECDYDVVQGEHHNQGINSRQNDEYAGGKKTGVEATAIENDLGLELGRSDKYLEDDEVDVQAAATQSGSIPLHRALPMPAQDSSIPNPSSTTASPPSQSSSRHPASSSVSIDGDESTADPVGRGAEQSTTLLGTPIVIYDSSSSSSSSGTGKTGVMLSTQVASLKGALSASRMREEALKTRTGKLQTELNELRWKWKSEQERWRRREGEMQGIVTGLRWQVQLLGMHHQHQQQQQHANGYYAVPIPGSNGVTNVASYPFYTHAHTYAGMSVGMSMSVPGPSPTGMNMHPDSLGETSGEMATLESRYDDDDDDLESSPIAEAILKRPGSLRRNASASANSSPRKMSRLREGTELEEGKVTTSISMPAVVGAKVNATNDEKKKDAEGERSPALHLEVEEPPPLVFPSLSMPFVS